MKNDHSTRKCRKCGEVKPLDGFPVYDREHGYRRHECRECNKKRVDSHHKANAVRRKRMARERYAADPSAKWTPERRKRANELAKIRNVALRNEVFDHYGRECSCCGETEPMFLTLDHKDNNGGQMRREVHGETSSSMYRWIIKNGFPKIFQVLCMNCNWGRFRNGGSCPHKKGSTTRS